ncbi:MAG: indolepyruvate ferredoxin oxidoreductase family protein [Betaproteobacteria bacterium]|nr:indolepyruvate ferredoxin oxidoreductase family protein [Betaproteobacteria bacterium]
MGRSSRDESGLLRRHSYTFGNLISCPKPGQQCDGRKVTVNAPEHLQQFSLDDKYTLKRGQVFMTGIQALVRLAMLQKERDEAAGLNTAGFVSGYRGSPLGGFDMALWKATKHLGEHRIHFQPGINEDLAATAVWGTQQVNLFPGARYDGVFAMWYGKGPGVDRCVDVFKHANSAGTSKHGGVLVLAGDDHGCKSSTLPHQSEHALKACMIPVLHPSSVQDYLDLGVHGFAMSRYTGCWVGFKCVGDIVESGAIVDVDPDRVKIVLPEDFAMPRGGNHIRWPDPGIDQEARLLDYKVYGALAYCRSNRLDRIVLNSPNARMGIATTGKSYGDVMQALADLGIDERVASDIGLRVYKIAMPWPLEPEGARSFAAGLEEILVVEEKRQLIEYQIKEELYTWREGQRPPRVVGKFDDNGEWSIAAGQPAGNWLLPAHYELSPAIIAGAIASRLQKLGLAAVLGSRFHERVAYLERKQKAMEKPHTTTLRRPHFCSGCPHNTSTRVPEGSRAMAGIGCHYMALWMDRGTETFTHMGGEGVPWIGQAPFTDTPHVFANLGDGTYYHSGLLAIRAAVGAGVSITYKILYNDAVAMTGGQHVDGPLDPAMISRQLAAEGVQPIIVVTDEPEKYPPGCPWAEGTTIRHRDDLDAVQRELREVKGVSAIIYDQTCASEKRRRRKRNEYPDPARRVVINELVCEGCGDCSTASNCLSVEPLETEFGRKRTINQSSCNKDFSCLKGFCPSFVTVEGGSLRKGSTDSGAAETDEFGPLATPVKPALDEPYNILIAGIGGTGVITIGQILAVAAHMEGKAATVLDMSGLAQKFGPVMSHVRMGRSSESLHAVRVGTGTADLVIGCDLVVTTSVEAISTMHEQRTRVLINSDTAPTAEFTRNPDWRLPGGDLRQNILDSVAHGNADFVAAGSLAGALLGDAIATNMFMLGYAFQKGWIPLEAESIDRAIGLNDVSVKLNQRAFQWGRRAAADLAHVERRATPGKVIAFARAPARNLDETISRRSEFLVDYQDSAYATRYRNLVGRVRAAEAALGARESALTAAVASSYFKLLAYKDEYEVARLHTQPEFHQRIDAMFEGSYRLKFHLAPPVLNPRDPVTGVARKSEFGPWILTAFRLLARLKGLRGSVFDVFGRTAERRMERQLITDYERTIEKLLAGLSEHNLATAAAIAAIPQDIRGYGHVKLRGVEFARKKEARLLAAFHAALAGDKAAAA